MTEANEVCEKIVCLAVQMGVPGDRVFETILPLVQRIEQSDNPLSDLLWARENAALSVTEKMVCALMVGAVL